MIKKIKWYTRAMIRSRPHILFVFGDNMEQRGYGGQAKEARGEPNSVGIPTKWKPAMIKASFFSDADLPHIINRIDSAINILERHLKNDGTVVIPVTFGEGGLSNLQECAPKIYGYIHSEFNRLSETYGME